MTPALDLRDHVAPLARFVAEGVERLAAREPKTKFEQIGIYSCPWSGWVSLCVSSRPQEVLNCPDMDHVEVESLAIDAWNDLYEEFDGFEIVTHDGRIGVYDSEATGDEGFNEPVFRLLLHVASEESVLAAARELGAGWIGIQMLDSEFALNRSV